MFPGQLHRVIEHLARDSRNQVVHCSQRSVLNGITGVRKITYKVLEHSGSQTHLFVRQFEDMVHHAETLVKVGEKLKEEGFIPDLIYGYAGWGPTLFMKDVFKNTPLLCYFEWFLNPFGAEYNFDPEYPLSFDGQRCLKVHNTANLLDLNYCDHGVSPTHWQKQQFPQEYQSKISVLHDGVDTEYYQPHLGYKLVLPKRNLDLSHVEELVTYVGRGLEPFRGFPQFIRAIAIVLKKRPKSHVVIVGGDQVFYSRKAPDGQTYRELMLKEVDLDLTRVHFTGLLPLEEYRQVLLASSVHVYLTYPYVLSWSLMESMACGCLIVGSNTPPVKEVIEDGVNGLLVDFFDHQAIADSICRALEGGKVINALRKQARQTILDNYDLKQLLPRHLDLISQFLL